MTQLYIIATPIGNLEDITLRAIRLLREVDFVIAEDTRVTKKLLSHLDIRTSVVSFHGNSTLKQLDSLVEKIIEAESVALVTDSGTPAISDPGMRLVEQLYMCDVDILPVPGPSAVTTALSVSGISSSPFTFYGFPPQKKGRQTFFKTLANVENTVVLYESPHRIEKTLISIHENFDSKRKIFIAREMTKMFETYHSLTIAEIPALLQSSDFVKKGEFVVIIG